MCDKFLKPIRFHSIIMTQPDSICDQVHYVYIRMNEARIKNTDGSPYELCILRYRLVLDTTMEVYCKIDTFSYDILLLLENQTLCNPCRVS